MLGATHMERFRGPVCPTSMIDAMNRSARAQVASEHNFTEVVSTSVHLDAPSSKLYSCAPIGSSDATEISWLGNASEIAFRPNSISCRGNLLIICTVAACVISPNHKL